MSTRNRWEQIVIAAAAERGWAPRDYNDAFAAVALDKLGFLPSEFERDVQVDDLRLRFVFKSAKVNIEVGRTPRTYVPGVARQMRDRKLRQLGWQVVWIDHESTVGLHDIRERILVARFKAGEYRAQA